MFRVLILFISGALCSNIYSQENDSLIQPQRLYTVMVDANPSFAGTNMQVVYPSTVTLFIILGLILFTIIKYNFGKNIQESFLSFINYRQSLRIFYERNESDKQTNIFSHILFSLSVGIFISLVIPFFGARLLWSSYTLSILFFSVTTCSLYVLKAQIWKVFGIIFMFQKFSKIYIYNMFLHNRIIGLIIFPLVAVVPYISENIAQGIIYVVIATFVLSYLFKFFRIFQIINAQNVSVLYFILYLCSLEILPLLLFVKCCKMLSESMFI